MFLLMRRRPPRYKRTDTLFPYTRLFRSESVSRYSGAKAVPMRLREENGFAFNADEVLAQITPATRLLIVNSPANPTGGVTPKAEIDKLVTGLERHPQVRSEERRVGKECVSTCRSRWSPYQ